MATGRSLLTQVVDLGPNGSFASFNESALPAGGALGQTYEFSGKVYRLVKFDNGAGNVASVAGGVAHWKDRDAFVVSSDQSDAVAGINGVAGAFLGVITDAYYCFVQIGGKQAVKVAVSTAAGDSMIGSATDQTLARMPNANATYDGLPVAVAYSAIDTPTTGFAYVYWLLGNLL